MFTFHSTLMIMAIFSLRAKEDQVFSRRSSEVHSSLLDESNICLNLVHVPRCRFKLS